MIPLKTTPATNDCILPKTKVEVCVQLGKKPDFFKTLLQRTSEDGESLKFNSSYLLGQDHFQGIGLMCKKEIMK